MATNEDATPYEMVSQAGQYLCDVLKRVDLTYDDAPEIYLALSLIHKTMKSFDGLLAMAERHETEAVIH